MSDTSTPVPLSQAIAGHRRPPLARLIRACAGTTPAPCNDNDDEWWYSGTACFLRSACPPAVWRRLVQLNTGTIHPSRQAVVTSFIAKACAACASDRQPPSSWKPTHVVNDVVVSDQLPDVGAGISKGWYRWALHLLSHPSRFVRLEQCTHAPFGVLDQRSALAAILLPVRVPQP